MKNIVVKLIKIYQKLLSSPFDLFFGRGCRYSPTCSNYAIKSIEKFGLKKGMILTLKRVSRCHPFYQGDYYDPVPIKI